MTRRQRFAVVVVMLASVLAGGVPPVSAQQDREVVFLHGFASDGDTWRGTADALQQVLRLTAHTPTTRWYTWMEDQANSLQGGYYWLPDNAVAVGHSNGGLVARQWARQRAFDGIVTLGTPHEGALLAQRVFAVLDANMRLYNIMNMASGMIRNPGPGLDEVRPLVLASLLWAGQLATITVRELTSTLAVSFTAPVIGQMVPGSAFLSSLNSGGNLAREDHDIRRRVGLIFVAHEYWKMGPAVGLRPELQDPAYNATQVAIAALESGAFLLRRYSVWWPAQQVANLLREGAQILRNIDPMWCWAVTNDPSCATSHDGIVSTPAQFYPGGQNYGYLGVPHVWQTRQGGPMIYDALHRDIGIARRDNPAPGPPPGGPPPGGNNNEGVLPSGRNMTPNQRLYSPDRTYFLTYQDDGNLVLYNDREGRPIWASQTSGTAAGTLEMQGDGNLVTYAPGGIPIWASSTAGNPGAFLEVRNSGLIVIVAPNGTPIWWSGGQ
ncbi:MAG: hypothetical protein IT178_01465 [Acidobacteria bacterium]|nr:hypothetical protein [Acidobacteriota bacterium]